MILCHNCQMRSVMVAISKLIYDPTDENIGGSNGQPWRRCGIRGGIPSGYDVPGDGETLLRSGLSLRHMRMIAALDDHGRVSAAAQVMNISQPAASRMIAEMEAVLDVRLCERLPRGITLTPYGKALARRARSILLEMREADREISELKAGKGGSVFLGAVTAPRSNGGAAIARSVASIRASRSPCRSRPPTSWRAS